MGAITFLKNTTGIMTPTNDFVDTGWVASDGFLTHSPCNPGRTTLSNLIGMIVGHTYNVTYDVFGRQSGGVNFRLGTTDGASQTANITGFSQNLLCAGNTDISFYSDGQLSVGNLVIYDLAQDSVPFTFAYNEKNKLWTETASFVPDMGVKFGDDFFTFKNGAMWKHNSNPIAGNFYGVQYPAQVTFFMNSEPGSIKLLANIIIESNKKWWCPTIAIKPYTGKSFGMLSRIKIGQVVVLQGVFYADFKRNMLDPRFGTQLEALLYGEELRGRVVSITIQNDDTEPVVLYKVLIKYTKQMLTP